MREVSLSGGIWMASTTQSIGDSKGLVRRKSRDLDAGVPRSFRERGFPAAHLFATPPFRLSPPET